MRGTHALGASRFALVGLALLTLLGAGAQAQTTFEYNVQPRTIRACRLLIPYQDGGGAWVSQGMTALRPLDDVRHSLIFEGMRRFPDRPTGWDIENPFAAGNFTKSDPGYWEVQLDQADPVDNDTLLPIPCYGPQLSNYDLIYIYAGGDDENGDQVRLNLNRAVWRQALLRAVQAGAVVWIDQRRSDGPNYASAGTGLAVQSFAPPGPVETSGTAPFDFTVADQTQGSYRRFYAGDYPADAGNLLSMTRDWLLRYPFKLDEVNDVQYLGMLPAVVNTGTRVPDTDVESASPDRVRLDLANNTNYAFRSAVVVSDGGGGWWSNIAVARYGAGAIVVSASDVGFDVVNWWRGAMRNRPRLQEAADCRFAWNVAALATNFAERGGNAANTGVTAATVPGPLSINWQFPDRFENLNDRSIGAVVSTPAVGRNMVFAVSLARATNPARDPLLIAFDADPAQDLDGDGRADDGVADYATGRSYDVVWSTSLGADWTPRWSSPTVTTIRWGGFNVEVVLVSVAAVNPGNGSRGEVRCYRASDGALLWTRYVDPYDSNGTVLDVSTPAVYGDFACVVASEHWTGAEAGGTGIEDTYGRAHCFALSYAWNSGDQNGPQWVYPSPSTDPNGDSETDTAIAEPAKSLPPFQDPYWVAGVAPFGTRPILPPFPTQKPTLAPPDGPFADSGLDVLLHCSTPVSFWWNDRTPANAEVDINPGVGGTDYVLVPTPRNSASAAVNPLGDLLNARAYRVWLPQAVTTLNARPFPVAVARTDAAAIDATVTDDWQDPADGRVYACLRSGEAREYLLPETANSNWLALAQGCAIPVQYQVRDNDTIAWDDTAPSLTVQGLLRGPVRQATVSGTSATRRVAAATVSGGTQYLSQDGIEGRLTGQPNGVLLRNDRAAVAGNASNSQIIARQTDFSGTANGSVTNRAIAAAATGAVRNANLVTITTTTAHGLRPHDIVTISGVTDTSFNGTFAVETVPTATTLTYRQVAGNVTSGAGMLTYCRDTIKWTYDARSALPGVGNRMQLSKGNLAVDRSKDSVYAAMAHTLSPDAAYGFNVRPQIISLNGQPQLQIQLRGGGEDTWLREDLTVRVETVDDYADAYDATDPSTINEVPATAYKVDPSTKTITFRPDQAGRVMNAASDLDNLGGLWGKPVWVTYTHTGSSTAVTDELHVLPDILRAQYTPRYIKLNHGMVRAGSVSFNLPNGIVLTRPPYAAPFDTLTYTDEATRNEQMTGLEPVASWTGGYLIHGVLDVRYLRLPSGEFLPPGSEIIVTYDYADLYYDAGAGTWYYRPVTAHERHQVPVNFGVPNGGPVVAGNVVHVGTEGYLPTGERGVALWNPDVVPTQGTEGPLVTFNGLRKSFLSVLIDPITRVVRGSLAQTVLPEALSYAGLGTPVTSATAAVDADGIVVGSRMMNGLSVVAAPANQYQGEDVGFVSRLKPERTLICDNTRLVEVTGQKPTWVCVGSTAAHYHETLNDPMATWAQDQKPTPFSRPAKAIYLANGNILVADSGNNRVIEIDRHGRQVWPLDANGYDYYTSDPALNTNLSLDRPSDCFRYYVTVVGGNTYTSTHGNMLPGTESHTVIADPGNNRVVDVVTTVNALGVQVHTVNVLTPARIRLTEGMVKIAYTKAQPIFDPSTNEVIGYLCVAANLHQVMIVERQSNPAATIRVNPPYGDQPRCGPVGSTWQWLAWLYDYDIGGANYHANDPLVFRNIRDVQLVREGTSMYLTVTCGQYGGRLASMQAGQPTHFLGAQGAGIFEFEIRNPGTGWQRWLATDVAGGPAVTADDPTWWFTRRNYTYWDPYNLDNDHRRGLTNIHYDDAGNADDDDDPAHWLDMAWNPVSAIRLPVDRRPVGGQRQVRHLVANYAEIIQNLTRDNVVDKSSPASLFSSVFVVSSDDNNDNAPENDLHALDRREVIPDPHESDWPDPINQPAYADRR
ncbi:MAG: hypothetical protein ABFD96_02825 [Armatimonadia bacterium]